MKKEFIVKGMHCKSCEMLIKEGLEEITGVESATASATKGKVIVSFDASTVKEIELIEAIKKEGYRVVSEK
ncbi:MAG: heavy-metal-associated domain-containing protein [Candidatus Nanoarchaeia archaeon]